MLHTPLILAAQLVWVESRVTANHETLLAKPPAERAEWVFEKLHAVLGGADPEDEAFRQAITTFKQSAPEGDLPLAPSLEIGRAITRGMGTSTPHIANFSEELSAEELNQLRVKFAFPSGKTQPRQYNPPPFVLPGGTMKDKDLFRVMQDWMRAAHHCCGGYEKACHVLRTTLLAYPIKQDLVEQWFTQNQWRCQPNTMLHTIADEHTIQLAYLDLEQLIRSQMPPDFVARKLLAQIIGDSNMGKVATPVRPALRSPAPPHLHSVYATALRPARSRVTPPSLIPPAGAQDGAAQRAARVGVDGGDGRGLRGPGAGERGGVGRGEERTADEARQGGPDLVDERG